MVLTGDLKRYKVKILLLALVVILMYLFLPLSNPSFNLKGNSDYYHIKSEDSFLYLEGDYIELQAGTVSFHDINNIKLYSDGKLIEEYNASKLDVTCKNVSFIYLTNVVLNENFDNDTLIKVFNNYVSLEGNYSKSSYGTIRTKDNVQFSSNWVNSVLIEGTLVQDFDEIVIDMSNGYMEYEPGPVDLFVTNVERVEGYSFNTTIMYIDNSDLDLNIGSRFYNIVPVDTLFLKINPNEYSYLEFEDKEISIYGNLDAALLNGNNLMKNILFYWFDQKTEKINALATLGSAAATIILVIITFGYARSTHQILDQTINAENRSYIEKRLQKLYYPLLHVINSESNAIGGGGVFLTAEKLAVLLNLATYSYLARDEHNKLIEDSLLDICKSGSFDPSSSKIVDLKNVVNEDIEYYKNKLNAFVGD